MVSTTRRPATHATSPTDFEGDDWKAIGKRTWARVKEEHAPLLAAGLAFFGILALFPALIALVTIYGLVADPAEVQSTVSDWFATLSPSMQEVVTDQLDSIAQGSSGLLGLGLVLSLLGVLWAASSGMSHLIQALSVAFEVDHERGFVKRRGLALVLTLGALVLAALAIAALAIAPIAISEANLGAWGAVLEVAQWVVLGALVALALAALYRYAPNRPPLDWTWVTWGAVGATLTWLLASVAFSAYVANFASYGNTYGALGGVIILLLWLYLTSFVILLGAFADHEMAKEAGASPTQRIDLTTEGEGATARVR